MAGLDINSRVLRQFLKDYALPDSMPHIVATCGTGPFSEEEFDEFLEAVGIRPDMLTPDSEWLVIGREEWSPERLNQVLVKRRGMTLRVYSQGMFISYLASRCDPLDESEDVLNDIAAAHPALAFLSTEWPEWPTTEVSPSAGGGLTAGWPKTGMLSELGYHVGSAGPPPSERRARLKRLFEGTLPNVVSPAYIEEWGSRRSSERLMKLANTIAALCRNAKRKGPEMYDAVKDWEEDLEWLRSTYYEGHHHFEWPNTWID